MMQMTFLFPSLRGLQSDWVLLPRCCFLICEAPAFHRAAKLQDEGTCSQKLWSRLSSGWQFK